MSISLSTRQAYSELDSVLDVLDEEDRNKIPIKLRQLLKREKDHNYIKTIDINKSIEEQNLKEETLTLIAILNLKYWCEDEGVKEKLKERYLKNEEIILCKEKIVKKNLKLSENSKKYEDKINELITIRNSIINSNNEYKTKEIKDNILQINLNKKNTTILDNNKKIVEKDINDINNNEINNNEVNYHEENNEKNSLEKLTELIKSNSKVKSNNNNLNIDNNDNINNIFLNINKNLSEKEFISLQNLKVYQFSKDKLFI